MATDLNRPESLTELFVAFTRLALQGFGGVLAVAQRELVERLNWMTKEVDVDLLIDVIRELGARLGSGN